MFLLRLRLLCVVWAPFVDLVNEIRKVIDNCETCAKYGELFPRPVVGLPVATRFNETIAMDLKPWGSKYFLVIVDLTTRYCAAAAIHDKIARIIIKEFFLHWISLFGVPKKILSDNGCKFINNCEMHSAGMGGICKERSIKLQWFFT